MAISRTSISAGALIRHALMASEEVKKRVNKIYPVVTERADLPYILYRHTGLDAVATTKGGADRITFELNCFTAQYAEGIELAEAVRDALEGQSVTLDGLTLRNCYVTNFASEWDSDAHVQVITITANIN